MKAVLPVKSQAGRVGTQKGLSQLLELPGDFLGEEVILKQRGAAGGWVAAWG